MMWWANCFLNDVMSQPEGRLNQHGCALGSSDSKYFFCNTCMFFFMFWGQLEPSLQFQWNLLSSKWQTDKHNEIDMRHFSVFFVVVFLFSSSVYMYIYYVQECIHTAALFYCPLSLPLSHFFFSLGHSSLKIQSCWIQSCSAAVDMLEWRATDGADRAMMVVLTTTSSHKCWRQKTSRRYKH